MCVGFVVELGAELHRWSKHWTITANQLKHLINNNTSTMTDDMSDPNRNKKPK